MTGRPTDSLLRQLTDDLQPVRRIPRLRTVGLLVLVAGALGVAVNTLATGWPVPMLSAGLPWGEAAFLLTVSALALATGGSLLAALAGAVPGRERAARGGRVAAVVGVGLAVAGALWWALSVGKPDEGNTLASCVGCASHALFLSLAPALVVGLFLGRALARRPFLLAGFAAMGAVAFGAWMVQASCTNGGAIHVALGHVIAPLGLALVLVLPLSWLARRSAEPGDGRG